MTVSTNAGGSLIRRSNFLHNTKISSSVYHQQKEQELKRDYNHTLGRCISINEILHHILKYPEVITDLRFVIILTMSLELRTRDLIGKRTLTTNDDVEYTTDINDLRDDLSIERLFTLSQIETINDMQLHTRSSIVDKVTQFSLRSPELMTIRYDWEILPMVSCCISSTQGRCYYFIFRRRFTSMYSN